MMEIGMGIHGEPLSEDHLQAARRKEVTDALMTRILDEMAAAWNRVAVLVNSHWDPHH
jgi:dihydroxyacetone kinase